MTQVVEAVIKRVRAEFDEEHKMLAHVVHHALITGGVLDSDGKAILIPGRDGRDSAVEGPRGRNGVDGVDGVNGKDGRNGVDGKDGAPGKDGVSDIPGPVGERGIEGERGIPGPGMSKEAIVQLVMDLKRRGSI